jgi:hypothetical protein
VLPRTIRIQPPGGCMTGNFMTVLATALAATVGLSSCGGGAPAEESDLSKLRGLGYDTVGGILPDDLNGWTLVDVEGYRTHTGAYEVANSTITDDTGPAVVTVTWRPASGYQSYVADRGDDRSEEIKVIESAATLFTMSPRDFSVVVPVVHGRSFVEVRGTHLGRRDFDAFLISLMSATPADFERALNDAGLRVDGEGDSV